MSFVPHIEDGPDTIKILLTTDNHVGYKENDPIRCDDSWKTFNEIIVTAKERDVDMIVHGGDLFDKNKPSKTSLFRVMESLRSHCFGDKPCELELMSDFAQRHSSVFPVNYEDPNLNVSIPIFGINGNHDDATGSTLLSPMDILSVSGLINMFGGAEDGNNITVSPILLQKGSSKFALYGLSHVKDDRLFRLFKEGNVKFLRPNVMTDDWFNLFCAHQNHVAYSSAKGYLPEQVLPDFLDFVYWGHEHECNTVPAYNQAKDFHTLLAGSSIVTSLSDSEVSPKHTFILRVKNRQFSLEPIPLKTARPFLMKTVGLAEEGLELGYTTQISNFLCEQVEEMIEQSTTEFVRNLSVEDDEEAELLKRDCPLPLIRLRVDVSGGYEVENLQRLSRRFVGKVANTDDIFSIQKRPVSRQKLGENGSADVKLDDPEQKSVMLRTVIDEFVANSNLYLLPEVGLSESMNKFIEKDEKNAFTEYIKQEKKRGTGILLDMDINNDEQEEVDPKVAFKALIHKLDESQKNGNEKYKSKPFVDQMDEAVEKLGEVEKMGAKLKLSDEEMDEPKQTKGKRNSVKSRKSAQIVEESESDEFVMSESDSEVQPEDSASEEEPEAPEPKPASTRGRGRGGRATRGTRGSTRGSTRGRGRGSKNTTSPKKSSLLDSLMGMGN